MRHARMFENEAANKMIDDVHKLLLLLIEHQHMKIATQLMLIQKQIRQT